MLSGIEIFIFFVSDHLNENLMNSDDRLTDLLFRRYFEFANHTSSKHHNIAKEEKTKKIKAVHRQILFKIFQCKCQVILIPLQKAVR